MPLQASPLRPRGIGEQDSSTRVDPFLAGEDTSTPQGSSLVQVGDHDEDDDEENSIFGNDLDDLVLYYSSRPVDPDDEEEGDASEVEDEDVDEDEDEDEDGDGDEDEDVVEGEEVDCGPVSPDSTPYVLASVHDMFMALTESRRECAAEEEESAVEGNEDTDENPSSHCGCATYVYIPPFTHYCAHHEIIVVRTVALQSLSIQPKTSRTTHTKQLPSHSPEPDLSGPRSRGRTRSRRLRTSPGRTWTPGQRT